MKSIESAVLIGVLQQTGFLCAGLITGGGERALIYKALVLTGLRKGELASLTVGQLELEGRVAFAVLDAGGCSTFTPCGTRSERT